MSRIDSLQPGQPTSAPAIADLQGMLAVSLHSYRPTAVRTGAESCHVDEGGS